MINRRLQRIRAGRDEGTTLIEILAGLTVMGIFLAMFAGTITNVYRSTAHFEATTVTTGQTNNIFLKLDKMIRYASAISTPSTSVNSAGNWYVEFQTSNTGASVCTQLQLNINTKQLKARTWTVPSAGTATGLTSFYLVTAGLAPVGQPFTLQATGDVPYEQLTVNLSATYGNPSQTTASNVTFTALNSNASSQAAARTPTAPNTVCQETNRP